MCPAAKPQGNLDPPRLLAGLWWDSWPDGTTDSPCLAQGMVLVLTCPHQTHLERRNRFGNRHLKSFAVAQYPFSPLCQKLL